MYMYHSEVGLSGAVAVPAVETNSVNNALEGADVFEESANDYADSAEVVVSASDSIDSENLRAGEMYDFAMTWYTEHREDLSAAIEQFKTVVKETRGTKYSLMAQQEIRRLEQLQTDKLSVAIADIQRKLKPLVANNEFDKAIRLVRKYDGPYAEETMKKRHQIVSVLIKNKEKWEEKQHRKASLRKIERQRCIDSLVMAVLSDDLDLAVQKISDMEEKQVFAEERGELRDVHKVLVKASKINEKILQSFKSQYGETIDVYLEKGMRTLTIRGISGDCIECRQMLAVGHGAVSTINISVDDLSDYERLRRMGDDTQYDVALVKGIMAFQSNAYSHAEKYFNMTHPLLAGYLLARMRGRDRPRSYGEIESEAEVHAGAGRDDGSEPVDDGDVWSSDIEEPVEVIPVFDREQKRLNRRFDGSRRRHDRKRPNTVF
jgi:hypothetical protein